MSILVVDYHMGNLGSVRRALEELDADVILSDDPADLRKAERFVLPGVGSFREGMEQLHALGWVPEILNAVREGIPMLGICLGMQLLMDKGCEGGETQGLSLIPGNVDLLDCQAQSMRIPHIGWNEVRLSRPTELFKDILSGTDFYFVHSYQVLPADPGHAIALTPYGSDFVSAVQCGRTYGVQFHPEKSGKPGFKLLQNFMKL